MLGQKLQTLNSQLTEIETEYPMTPLEDEATRFRFVRKFAPLYAQALIFNCVLNKKDPLSNPRLSEAIAKDVNKCLYIPTSEEALQHETPVVDFIYHASLIQTSYHQVLPLLVYDYQPKVDMARYTEQLILSQMPQQNRSTSPTSRPTAAAPQPNASSTDEKEVAFLARGFLNKKR